MSSSIRRLVHFCFAYTCIEGFVVNLTYPNVLSYIVKDAAILLLYAFLITERRAPARALRKIATPILAFIGVMLFFIIVPTPVTLLAEFVALKQRLFYIPLMYVAYLYVQREEDFFRLIQLMAWTAIPTSLFCIYLFFAGPRALQALGGMYSAVVYSTTGAAGIAFWRVPGTFTSPGQYSLYLLIQSVVLTGYLFVPTLARREKTLASVALALSFGALLVSGTRTPLVMYLLCVGISLFYMGRLTKLGVAALGLYAAMSIGFMYFGAGVEDRVGSVLTQENYDRFRNTAFGQAFYQHIYDSPLGYGLGTATIAGRHFTDWSKLIFVESYFGVIAAETGYLGLISSIWMMATIGFALLSARVKVRGAAWSQLWYFTTLIILAIIGLMPSSTMIESAPGNMYFWFLIGAVMRLVDLEQIRASRLVAPVEAPARLAPQHLLHAPR